MIWLKVN